MLKSVLTAAAISALALASVACSPSAETDTLDTGEAESTYDSAATDPLPPVDSTATDPSAVTPDGTTSPDGMPPASTTPESETTPPTTTP